jgi:hypothetical protein
MKLLNFAASVGKNFLEGKFRFQSSHRRIGLDKCPDGVNVFTDRTTIEELQYQYPEGSMINSGGFTRINKEYERKLRTKSGFRIPLETRHDAGSPRRYSAIQSVTRCHNL